MWKVNENQAFVIIITIIIIIIVIFPRVKAVVLSEQELSMIHSFVFRGGRTKSFRSSQDGLVTFYRLRLNPTFRER